MKKSLHIMLVIFVLLAAVACGSNAPSTTGTSDKPMENGAVAAPKKEAEPAKSAEKFPEKPVKLVIPYPPGGGTDVLFRLIASYAEKHLGQTIVPANMAGATATVGSRHVKDAKSDGYTILGIHQVAATAHHTGIVDYGFSAFAPVSMVTSTPHIPAVSKTFSEKHGIKTINDFVKYVKENPGKVTWAYTVGSEDHYTVAAFLDKAGVDPRSMKYVNYSGTAPQYAALVANQVDGMTADYASGKGYFSDGVLVPLGMVFDERNPYLPNVPTLKEQGIDFAVTVDRGILAPKGTPDGRIQIINNAFKKAMEDPELKKKIEELGSFVNFKPNADYKQHLEKLDATMEKLKEKMKF